MMIGLSLALTQPRGGEVLGPELLGTGTTGLTGTATAATYDTSTGAGSATRVDASNQSFVQFAVEQASTYRVSLTNTGTNNIALRRATASGTLLTTVGAGATVVFDAATLTSTALVVGSQSGTQTFVVNSIRKVG